MRDLADIDRLLGELGQPSQDPKGLLERALGADRSLDRLDAMLGELAPGVRPATPSRPVLSGRHARWSRPAARAAERPRRTSEPARVAGGAAAFELLADGKDKSARATLVGIPSQPPVQAAADEGAQAAEGDGLIGLSDAPVEPAPSFGSPAESVQDEPELSLGADDTDPEIQLSPQEEPEAVETDTGSWQRPAQSASAAQVLGFEEPDQSGSADADAVTRISTPPDAAEQSETTRRNMRSLLDQQLDPEEFANEPAAPDPDAVSAEAQDESDDDFELLIDDEEILEIEELDEE